jgi:glycosyltransferase involved in cell wall biosynthesis
LLRLRGARLAFVSEPLRALANVRDAIVQPMGVDLDHFATLEPRPTSPPTLAVLARLVPIKGVDTAIAAMAHVTTRARLVIAGDGPERARLASPHAELLGELLAPARDELLRRASIVIIPSRVLPNGRTEGTPLVALEALAAGIPVIASRVGGLSDLPITLVPPDDPHALGGAIDHVLAHPPHPAELRASVASRGWPRVSERLLAHALIR